MVARKYMLDTNILIAMFKGQHQIQERLVHEGFEKCIVSDMSLSELYYGAYKSGNQNQLMQVDFVKRNFEIAHASYSIETFAKLRAMLELKGERLLEIDLMIASSALDNNYILVTNNVKHFSKISKLEVRDWFEEHSRQITAEKYLSFR